MMKPDRKIRLAISKALSGKSTDISDAEKLARMAEASRSDRSDQEKEEILSLDKDDRDTLMSLLSYTKEQELDTLEDMPESPTTMVEALVQAKWTGILDIGFDKEIFRVGNTRGRIHLPQWTATVFELAKRIARSKEEGIWPGDQVEFFWPGDQPLLKARIQNRIDNPEIFFRVGSLQKDGKTPHEIEIEYWMGDRWIGNKILGSDSSELRITLKPGWPFLFSIRSPEPHVLKVNCRRSQFSEREIRSASLLRCLIGDIRSGFELIDSSLVPHSKGLEWVLSLVSQCLPELALQPSFAVVREPATRHRIRNGMGDLFATLAHRWLGQSGTAPQTKELQAQLEAKGGDTSRGFLLAMKGDYEQAVEVWKGMEEEGESEKYVAAALFVAQHLLSGEKIDLENRPLCEEEDIDRVVECLSLFKHCTEPQKEGFERLSDILAEVCR